MKFLYMFGGFGLGLALFGAIQTANSSVSVGDCVRDMGYTDIERVTYVAPNGSIETQDDDGYFTKHSDNKSLIKVNCPK